jgi:pimeloyl-ACP methyl ester carboxylesterase
VKTSDAADRSVELADGRRLGYREFGAPDGFPVVNCHGGLVCGLDIAAFHDAAVEAGVRIVSPDRPGLGNSSAAPDRTTADWATDVAGLLDHLVIARAAVFGWSMGGQYALACSALLAERVTRTVVVAGALPLDNDATFSQLNLLDRQFTRLAQRHPKLARTKYAALGLIASRAPSAWPRIATHGAVPEEAAAMHALGDPSLAAAAAGALAHPAGMVEEYRAWARPWGFEPESIAGPVRIWQGEADSLVPPAWARELARRIPDAQLELLSGAGHFLAYRHQREIIRDLIVEFG